MGFPGPDDAERPRVKKLVLFLKIAKIEIYCFGGL
jgi:hypothetical protein